ncbi:hypothetical protein KZ483_09440 [Paenibacillus sp. sptzw28]|uniref:hypothetical protein n=1 Tax=Paenibacillus sp. sptzw28 TaxID=715179 RepID=UPI001C6F1F1A|nr:hypothetical protein [Paenibacillus sp. sptzw28]QYR23114.1 hypothetical protein KZ483_09440 [Paenibacillus sp. sptzw28]
MIMTLMVNGSIPQLQMFLFNGSMVIPVSVVKAIAVILGFGGLLLTLRRKIELYTPLMLSWLLFTAYIMAETALLPSPDTIDSITLVASILSVYFFIFTIPLVLHLRNSLQEKQIAGILISLFVILAALGIVQFLLNEPLLPVVSNDSSFKVYSSSFQGNQRAFSLFESGYSFGHYIAVAGALILLMPMRKFWKFILIAIVIFAGYSTLTRNTYLEIGSALIAALILSKNRSSGSAGYILMVINALAGFAVMKLAPIISGLFGQLDIFDIYTHTSRVTEWDGIMRKWLSSDIYTALFGTGLTQGFGFNYVDNMYLAVGAQFGILGLIVFGLLFISMTQYVFKQAAIRKTPLATAIAAFWTTFPIVSFFNISLPPYVFVFIILIIGNKGSERARRAATNFMSGKMKAVTSVLSAAVIIGSVLFAELLAEILR